MNFSKVANPIWADAKHSAILLTIAHPVHGEIPFSASPNDSEKHGRDLYAKAIAGEFGAIAEFTQNVESILAQRKEEAQLALEETDMVAIRCWKAGIPFPSEWQKYTNDLRAVIRAMSVEQLPVRPDYPVGT